MKSAVRLAVGAILLGALAVSTAQAKDRGRLPIGVELNVRGSNGYAITIGGRGDEVMLAVSTRRAVSIYRATAGRITRDAIRARFGPLGAVDVTFSLRRLTSRPARRRKHACDDSPTSVVTRRGVFEGSIRFRGEHGYTEVSAGRARGGLTPVPHLLCARVGPGRSLADLGEGSEWPAEIRAIAFSNSSLTAFEAGRSAFASAAGLDGIGSFRIPKLGSLDLGFSAVSLAEQGKVRILRAAVARGGMGSYDFEESPRNLDIAPPAPFGGVGRYRSCAERAWTGSLSVSFPGAGRVALTSSRHGHTFALALGIPKFPESQCGVIPLDQSRLIP
jgi:hypothetical protein